MSTPSRRQFLAGVLAPLRHRVELILCGVDLTNACLNRIAALDHRLNSFVTVTADRASISGLQSALGRDVPEKCRSF